MKSNELRIGNWVYWDGEMIINAHNIAEIDYFQRAGNPLDVKGIPLTEEWLIRFGFEGDKYSPSVHFKKEYKTSIGPLGVINLVWDKNGYNMWYQQLNAEPLRYAHQLQNLFFALTSEELKTKE